MKSRRVLEWSGIFTEGIVSHRENVTMKKEIQFDLEKETPGTFRYAESAEPAERIIGTIYVRKSALRGEAAPKRIKVTIEG